MAAKSPAQLCRRLIRWSILNLVLEYPSCRASSRRTGYLARYPDGRTYRYRRGPYLLTYRMYNTFKIDVYIDLEIYIVYNMPAARAYRGRHSSLDAF